MKNCVKEFTKKYSNPLFTAVSTVILALSGAFVGGYKWSTTYAAVDNAATFIAWVLTNPYLGLILGFIILLINELGRHYKTQEIEANNAKLNTQLEKYKGIDIAINGYQENIQNLNSQILTLQTEIAVSWLKQVSKQYNMNSSERASIYFELNKEFILLARHSSNPNFKEIHRQKFPLNQGVISKAWSHGECIEKECPQYENDVNSYYNYMTEAYGFSEEDLKNFKMKSCWYIAIAISKADDHLGVVVFESTKQNILEDKDIGELISYCKSYQSHLVKFIEESKALEIAQRMGQSTDTDTDTDILASLNGEEK